MEILPHTEESDSLVAGLFLQNVDYAKREANTRHQKRRATAFNNGRGALSSMTSHSTALRAGDKRKGAS